MTKHTPGRNSLMALCAGLAIVGLPRAGFSLQQDQPFAEEMLLVAKTIPEWLSRGEFARVTSELTPEANERLPQERLQEVWQVLTRQLGPYHGTTGARMDRDEQAVWIIVGCQFEKAPVSMKVSVDAQRRITGLWFNVDESAPAEPPPDAPRWGPPPSFPSPPPQPAEPATPSAGVREREVVVGEGEWALPGTLTLPAGVGPFPAIVLVHGSGPQDRDESIGPNRPFRDLAAGLAEQGIAVLRYDKRTQAHGQRIAAVVNSLTAKEEVVDDAMAAVALLRSTKEVEPRRLFVLGHSFGGMLLPRIAAADGRLAGGVILAGNTRPVEELIVEQTRYIAGLDGSIMPAERVQLDYVEAQAELVKDPQLAERASTDTPPFGVAPAYWLDLQPYRPAAVAAELHMPMLLLQGERDYQVTMEDFEGWKRVLAARPHATFKSYPLLNHLFMPGEGRSTPAEYEHPGHVSPVVINDIAEWIKRQEPHGAAL